MAVTILKKWLLVCRKKSIVPFGLSQRKLLLVNTAHAFLVALVYITLVFNVAGAPRAPVYFYSLLPEAVEIPWFYYLNIVLQIIFGLNITIMRTQLDMFWICFSDSVRVHLCTLTAAIQGAGDHEKSTVNDHVFLPEVVEILSELNLLTSRLNRIGRWSLLIFKAISVVFLPFIIHSAIRIRSETTDYVVSSFISVAAMVFIRVWALIYTLGRMHAASAKLLQVLLDKVTANADFDRHLWHRVSTLQPIGLQCGALYGVGPTTVLVYISVVVSYLAVIFQIKDNN